MALKVLKSSPAAAYASIADGGTVLKKQSRSTKPGEAMHEIDGDDTTDVAAHHRAPFVTEHVVHQRVHVARVRGQVVDVVGREVAVAVAAQIGGDDLEARRRQHLDVAPPDALGLRIPVQQQHRVAANALAHIGDRQLVAHDRTVDRERVGSGSRGLRWAPTRVVAQSGISTSRRSRVSSRVLMRQLPSIFS